MCAKRLGMQMCRSLMSFLLIATKHGVGCTEAIILSHSLTPRLWWSIDSNQFTIFCLNFSKTLWINAQPRHHWSAALVFFWITGWNIVGTGQVIFG